MVSTVNHHGSSLTTAKQGDNVLGSVRLSVRLSCRQSTISEKSNNPHYQSKVFVCVPVISWYLRTIVQMWSTGF